MLYIRAQKARKTFWAVLTDKDEVKVLKKAPYKDLVFSGETYRLSEVKLLAPCEPTKIVAVGKNYKDHALEMKSSVPDHPIIFIKPATSLNNPEDDIVYPEASKRVDYEGELAFVVKKKAHMIKKDNAFDYILGYTCLNDVTARDIQDLDGQWTRSKSFDGFAPVGPWVVDGIKPSGLKIETRLNGEVKQSSKTDKLMWDIPYLFEFITECMTLYPGDVVTTGTPSGIGPMQPGDTVEVCIEGIGILRNRITKRY